MAFVKEIKEHVHELYWEAQGNCADTMLRCLGELTDMKLDRQVFSSVAGLHGGEKLGAQCGLAIAGQLFIGIYYRALEKSDADIALLCGQYAEAFRRKFSSLQCGELRLSRYMSADPRHVCEQLTCDAVTITHNFLIKGE